MSRKYEKSTKKAKLVSLTVKKVLEYISVNFCERYDCSRR